MAAAMPVLFAYQTELVGKLSVAGKTAPNWLPNHKIGHSNFEKVSFFVMWT